MEKKPNYNRIYMDLIEEQFPDQKDKLLPLVSNKIESSLDVIKINKVLFNQQTEDEVAYNQKLRSYDEHSIRAILKHQRESFLTNLEITELFKISRNTVAKWKNSKRFV